MHTDPECWPDSPDCTAENCTCICHRDTAVVRAQDAPPWTRAQDARSFTDWYIVAGQMVRASLSLAS